MSRHAWVVSGINPSTGARMDIYQCHDCTANYTYWSDLADHYEEAHLDVPGRVAYVRGQADASVMPGIPQVVRCASGHHDWAKWNWVDHVNKEVVDDFGHNKQRCCKRTGCLATEGRYDTPPRRPDLTDGPHGVGRGAIYKHPGGKNGWTVIECSGIQCAYSVTAGTADQAVKRVTAHANDANRNHQASIDKLLAKIKADQSIKSLDNDPKSPW